MVRGIQRRDFLKGAATAGAVGLAGCTGGGGGGPTIRYGVLMPETGDLGSLGTTMRDGGRLPARQIEDEIDYSLDVQTEDTETNPQAGISSAQSLVDSGYPAVVGPAASNVNLQVTREVFIPNETVGISPSSTAPAVTDLEDDDYIFRTCPSDALQGPVMAQVVVDEFDASTAATLYLNDNYGQALEESFVNAFESEHDGQVPNRVSFEPEQSSYASQLGTALNDNPDVLMVVGFPQSGITLFRDYYSNYASDYGGSIIVPDGLIDSSLPEEVGNDMEDVWGTAPSAAGPGADFFANLYEEEWGNSPEVFNAQSYDAAAVAILASVAADADQPDGTAIRDNLRTVANPDGTEVGPSELADAVSMVADGESVNYVGASSPVDFDDNGDMRAVSYDVSRYLDGGLEVQRTIEFEN
ncbi:ABC transporter substrate-binding protein [Haloparvum alkalitolerans]|uniref:ABC transporter substrate-binding protein n=1 Tax=Haloparvum alkalitolerans TaxID=1042953 RepID=UPI003CE930A9